MSRLQNLLASLPRPFSKDPIGVTALTVAYNTGGNFVVDTGVLRTVVNGTALVITLTNRTMLDVANLITAVTGYSATVGSGLNAVSALALVDGQYISIGGQSVAIPYFTSGTYRVLAPIARALDDLDAAMAEGLRQIDLRQASGVWLDRIGALYGLTRNPLEPDLLFSRRIVQSVISAKTNGYALVMILQKALGVASVITDGAAAHFTVTITFDLLATFTYDTTTINSLITRYKAFGTVVDSLSFKTSAAEVYNTAGVVDSFSTSLGSPRNGEWGGPEFGAREFGT